MVCASLRSALEQLKSKDQQTSHQLEISREEVRKLEQAQLETMRVSSELVAAQRELEELRPLRAQLRERERERAAESMNIEVTDHLMCCACGELVWCRR